VGREGKDGVSMGACIIQGSIDARLIIAAATSGADKG
jgi:hypothetical protein